MKIYIIGSVASGKTTLAKKLSKKLDISWYELDSIVHMKTDDGEVRRTPEQIDEEFNKILATEKWIIEGVARRYFDKGFKEADKIILVDTPPLKRKYRILKRWVHQNMKLEECNYKPTIKMLFSMYGWSNDFDKSKEDLMDRLHEHEDKLVIVRDGNVDI